MLGMFRKTLRTGIVTSKYPDVAEAAPSAFRGRPVHAADRCDLNGSCVRVCPSTAIVIEEKPSSAAHPRTWQLDYARCVFCGLCVDACPSGALTQSNDFELAVKQRGDLIVRAVFVGADSVNPPGVPPGRELGGHPQDPLIRGQVAGDQTSR